MSRLQLRAFAAIVIFAIFLLAVYFPAFGQPPSPPPPSPPLTVQRVVAAERAFAALSVEKGMKEAFLANLGEDAVIFRPGPVPAVAWFRDHPAATGKLTWEPDFAATSAAGDLGYTSGPWEYREPGDDSAASGHFVTVWRRQADGSFKVAIDAGVRHEKQSGAVSLAYGGVDSHLDVEGAQSALLDNDRGLVSQAVIVGPGGLVSTSWVNAWLALAAPDVRLYRPNHVPIVGKDAAAAVLRASDAAPNWKPTAAVISSAGDLGYTYGICEVRPVGPSGEPVESAAYLRIWRLRPLGTYEIVLDLTSPIPPPKPKP